MKPEWLKAVLSAGTAEEGELSSLEEQFILPPTSKFRPSFQSSLPSRLKKYDMWEPRSYVIGHYQTCCTTEGTDAGFVRLFETSCTQEAVDTGMVLLFGMRW